MTTITDQITFLDPRAEPGLATDPYDVSIDPSAPGVRIGLLANGFPDSAKFLHHVEAALTRALPDAEFVFADKGDPTTVVSDAMIDDLRDRCGAVVAAYGH